MRILQVSAHYPPDFVSGGTLIPQRIAQGLAAAGHEVAVFAGELKTLAPLAERDSVEGGIDVHWIGVSAFLASTDPKNFDHPDAARAFERYLHRFQPEIVHFHAMQTLGGGLLRVAKDFGARVVVTMHDFWWVSSRQFLVQVAGDPMSLVWDCGRHDRTVSREWEEARRAYLGRCLHDADLVLAPSSAMARALVANGIDRVRVNENGINPPEHFIRPQRPIRFLYVGGPESVKGSRVIREALAAASVAPGTSASLVGIFEDLPQWARGIEPFEHDRLGEVLAEYDVLVLPSIAYESHSLITREALASGMAVICTDTLGPEEAVADGINGRVIPAGSVPALRAAIEELSQPERARSLMTGLTRPQVTPREQVAELVDYYRGLLAGREVGPGALARGVDSAIRRVVIVSGIQGASLRYRAHLPAEALATRGVDCTILHYRDPALEETALGADAVILYRTPATHHLLRLVERLREASPIIPIIGDVDDLIFDPEIATSMDNLASLSQAERDLWCEGIHRYRTVFEQCDFFIGSTHTVSAEAERLMGIPARTFDNSVPALLARASEEALSEPRQPGPPRIGFFSGTKTHDADWASIEPAVASVMRQRPDVELWLGGHVEPTAALDDMSDRIIRLPFLPWYELPTALRNIDICLAPLTESIFNESKSAIKWLEAALVATPTIASPTEPFRDAIDDGLTGILARGVEDWSAAMLSLLDDPLRREAMGRRAQRSALLSRSLALSGRAYQDIIREAWIHVARHGHRAPSTFPPVVNDEPPTELAFIEPYEGKPRQMGNLEKTWRSLRGDGLRVTAHRIRATLASRD